jgi:hypothetical protein
MWLLALPALSLAVLYVLLSRQSLVGGAPVFYPAVVLYYSTASALATAVLLVALAVLGLWIPQALGRRPRAGLNGLAVLAALVAGGLACWGTLPQTFAPYRHVDRAELNGRVYQLGVRVSASAAADALASYFVLCTCDSAGLTCRCRDLVPTTAEEITAVPELVADAARSSLAVRIGERTLIETEVGP